jgi:hypothetical protein
MLALTAERAAVMVSDVQLAFTQFVDALGEEIKRYGDEVGRSRRAGADPVQPLRAQHARHGDE